MPENKNSRNRIVNRLTAIFTVAVLAACIAIGAYVLKFDAGLSSNPEIWGQFGDYIGGVLNPFFALLGLIALLLTIVLQSRELEYTRQELRNSSIALEGSREIAQQQKDLLNTQDQKEDIYRVINFIYEEIKLILSRRINFNLIINETIDQRKMKIEDIFGRRKEILNESIRLLSPRFHVQEADYFNVNKDNLNDFIMRLRELSFYLNIFDSLSGKYYLTDFYRQRLFDIIMDMHGQEYIEVDLVDNFQVKTSSLA
ncbi:hypothetical protein [Desulfuromonas sp. TF]|uniref:hypothetical protein n=1 Tax=Desulfuromonas sp. TF TaxID=1232410 RepID=UPI00068559D1|nr:hypothetical protein [Desulfuromonas sp. TF]